MQNSKVKLTLAGLVAVAALGAVGASYELGADSQPATSSTASSPSPPSPGSGEASAGGTGSTLYSHTNSASANSSIHSAGAGSSAGASTASNGNATQTKASCPPLDDPVTMKFNKADGTIGYRALCRRPDGTLVGASAASAH